MYIVYANSFLGTLNTRQILRKKTAMASTYNGVAELSNFQHSVVPTQLVRQFPPLGDL